MKVEVEIWGTMKVEVEIWEMRAGKPTVFKFDNRLFVLDDMKHNVKVSYLKKWIQENSIKTFCLDEFFKEYPKQKKRIPKLNLVISDMIQDKELQQLGNDKFKVVKE